MENSKNIVFSKTQWFNALLSLIAAADTYAPFLQQILPIDKYQALLIVCVVGNMALRLVTHQPLTILPNMQNSDGTVK